MTTTIHKQAEYLFQPGQSGRAFLRLHSPLTGVGLVLPAFGMHGDARLDSNETGMT